VPTSGPALAWTGIPETRSRTEARLPVDTIPGVDKRTAEALLAEIGLDMSVFPSHRHLASWAGVCPGSNESGGKRKSGKTRKGSKWLHAALTQSAKAAIRTKGTDPQLPLRPDQRPPWTRKGDRRDRPLDPRLRCQ
jgi:transposase